MPTIAAYVLAAAAEIGGCFTFWAVVRLGKSPWWLGAGLASLVVFATALTAVDSAAAGRAYAAYGGIYIVASIVWLALVEGVRPDRFDLTGAAICLVGAGIILFGPRG